MSVRIDVKGLKELQEKFKEIPKNVAEEVDGAMYVAALDFVDRAQDAAPINVGVLKGQITSTQLAEMDWKVTSGADYSAFIEFGTRSRVQVPADLAQYAQQFKGGNGGGDAKTAIYEWCRLKGIDEKNWWWIFIKIMTVGINPHPFFFIQREPVYKQLVKDCQEAIKRAIK
jgi:hypothetical protein